MTEKALWSSRALRSIRTRVESAWTKASDDAMWMLFTASGAQFRRGQVTALVRQIYLRTNEDAFVMPPCSNAALESKPTTGHVLGTKSDMEREALPLWA